MIHVASPANGPTWLQFLSDGVDQSSAPNASGDTEPRFNPAYTLLRSVSGRSRHDAAARSVDH